MKVNRKMQCTAIKPGHIISDGKHFIKDRLQRRVSKYRYLQLEGKKRMNTVEFLRGFRINDYAIKVS